MRRLGRRAFLAAAAFLAIPTVRAAAAAPGPTYPPRRVGDRAVFDGYEWRGVRRGTSLVWRRGAAQGLPQQPRPSSSATASAAEPSAAKVTRAVGELGPISAIPDGVTSAWTVINSRGLARDVYIVRRGSSLTALDATCTHAGCVVALASDALRCGCHGATFDAVTGDSLGGPAGLAPLTRLSVTSRGDTVFIEGL